MRRLLSPTLLLMLCNLAGWSSAYVHSQRESDWHALAIKAVATAEWCANQKGRPSMEDLYPHNYMVMLTWGGRVFLMPRLPGDPPRVQVPDYAAIRFAQRESWSISPPSPTQVFPPHRNFCRVTWSGGDCPFYLEVK